VRPRRLLRLGGEVFEGARVACQGRQIAMLVQAIGRIRPGLVWYIADIQQIGGAHVTSRQPAPECVGDTAALVCIAGAVEQYESGVFAGVPDGGANPEFRTGGLWTEDEEAADLGDAIVELRAFDTTYVSLATTDEDIADLVINAFPGACEEQSCRSDV
jgi:hypothetical protein